VAAGSLVGVTVNRNQHSFPVGKVEMLTLYPMDFEEFLLALEEDALVSTIRKAYAADSDLPEALHTKALELYKTYLVVGGMPGAVWAYLKERHMLDAVSVQNLILSCYVADIQNFTEKFWAAEWYKIRTSVCRTLYVEAKGVFVVSVAYSWCQHCAKNITPKNRPRGRP